MNALAGPKRVLLSTDAIGGVWPYTFELARALSRRRVEVEIAILGPSVAAEQRKAVEALPGVRLHETGLPLDWTAEAPSALAIASNALAALAQRLGADIIQLHTPALVAQSLWHAPVIAVVHSCVGTWWSAVRRGAVSEDFEWRMTAVRAGMEAADCVVAPTRAFAEMVRHIYGLQREIDVIRNGRAPAGLPAQDPVTRHGVLTAGRLWDEGKGIAVLDGAAAMMKAIPVRAAGAVRGPNDAGIRLEQVEALGMLDAAQMAKVMTQARVFASAARYEPFGLAVLEAAQASLPLVLSDIPTFRELWDGAAIFLPPTDTAAWADALSTLHEQTETCRRWGMKARARAALYSMERFDGAMWEKHCLMLTPAARTAAAA